MREQCVGLNRFGEKCKAPVITGTDPPVCRRHSMTLEEFREQARRGGLKRQEIARAEDLRRDLDDHVEGQRVLQSFLRIVDGWLDAKLPGTAEPNAESVAWAMLVLATAFKLGTRDEVLDLLEEIRPNLAAEPQSHAFADVQAARDRLELALAEGRISRADLPGLLALR